MIMLLNTVLLALAVPAPQSETDRVNAPRVVLAEYAACALPRINGGRLADFMATPPSDPRAARMVDGLIVDACITGAMPSSNPRLMRGALFDAMERARRSGGSSGRAEPARMLAMSSRADAAAMREHQGLMQLGACVLAANAGGVGAVLDAPVASSREGESMAALMPAIGGCLPQGQSLSFSREVLRGVLAEASWRAAMAPAAPAQGS